MTQGTQRIFRFVGFAVALVMAMTAIYLLI